jgi:RNA polymerase sigma-70 factor (ECF subfamily)
MTIANSSGGESASRSSAHFATTHWSVVLAAGDSASPGSREALEKLCRTYWFPLYAFARRKRHSPDDPQDLTQAFFERCLEKHYLKGVVAEKGRFRAFLLTTFQRFLCDQFDHATAAKRGGGIALVALDTLDAEAQFHRTAAASESPEPSFDRAWAETVVQGSLDGLRTQYEAEGHLTLFDGIKRYLSQPADRAAYATAGSRLRLIGTVSNRDAVGAKVRARAAYAGADRWQRRDISGGALSNGNQRYAHFGLGDATNVTTLRIEWPSGIVQELANVAANQILTLTEPAPLVPLGCREFQIRCWKGMRLEVEKSHDLQAWTSLGTVTNLTGTLVFQDTQSPPETACCFYRAVAR